MSQKIALKTLAITALLMLSLRWLWFFVPWGLARGHGGLGWMTWLYAALNFLGTLGFCLAIACLSENNSRRVLGNVFLIIICSIVAAQLCDPLTRGSYDHRGGIDTLQGWLKGGIAGAAFGYAIVLVRGKTRPTKVEAQSEPAK